MSRERLRAAVFLLLLVGLTAVLATRAVRLARQPEELGAIGGMDERKWFHAAGPVEQAGTLGAVRSALPRGAEVWLRLPPGWDPGWWGWMARYHLPEQRIVLGEAAEAPAEAWVVEVGPEGKAAVRRPGLPR
ncbi:MAG: hypothetical protein ACJ759_10955 [Thermoanaerobaculia bacterium]